MKKQKLQPIKVKRITCKCGELQVKIYPWASFEFPVNTTIPPCKRCANKQNLLPTPSVKPVGNKVLKK